jgi:hypothetical protein
MALHVDGLKQDKTISDLKAHTGVPHTLKLCLLAANGTVPISS